MEPIALCCDVCGDPKNAQEICFAMRGCDHLPCFSCLVLPPDNQIVEQFVCISCPIPSCHVGFFLLHEEQKPSSQAEISSGSRQIQASPNFSCPICLEIKPTSNSFLGFKNTCQHSFCKPCIAGHIKAKIEQGVFSIGCPNLDCHGKKLEPEDCIGLISEANFRRWGNGLCELALSLQVKFYCPFQDCSALLINEGDEEGRPLREALCLHCRRLCCIQCRVPWHEGKSCEEFKREEGERREREEDEKVLELARSRKWQRCPKCGIVVEKIEGCVYIRCRCGHRFCYRCASPIGGNHFCQVCNLSWD